jgi:hypothetical protein
MLPQLDACPSPFSAMMLLRRRCRQRVIASPLNGRLGSRAAKALSEGFLRAPVGNGVQLGRRAALASMIAAASADLHFDVRMRGLLSSGKRGKAGGRWSRSRWRTA